MSYVVPSLCKWAVTILLGPCVLYAIARPLVTSICLSLMFPHLPLDIVLLVFDILADAGFFTTLKACALVCIDWHLACSSRLFSTFVAHGVPSSNSFACMHEFLQHRVQLASVVHSVRFHGLSTLPPANSSATIREHATITAADVQSVMRVCPTLKSITVEHCSLAPTTDETLTGICTDLSLELSVLTGHNGSPAWCGSLFSLCARWKSIHLRDVDWTSASDLTSPSMPFTDTLAITLGGEVQPAGPIGGLYTVRKLHFLDVAVDELYVVRTVLHQFVHCLTSVTLHLASDTMRESSNVLCPMGDPHHDGSEYPPNEWHDLGLTAASHVVHVKLCMSLDGRFDGGSWEGRSPSFARASILEILVSHLPPNVVHLDFELGVSTYMGRDHSMDLARVRWDVVGIAIELETHVEHVSITLAHDGVAGNEPKYSDTMVETVSRGLSCFAKEYGM